MASDLAERGPARRWLTLRARLTVSYAGLITGSGAVLIGLVYLYMRFVPSYHIVESAVPDTAAGSTLDPTHQGGVSITTAEDFLDNLLVGAGFALVVLALVGGLAGWIVAGRIIRPLGEIGSAARRASEGSLGHRVALDGPRDEIRDLADTFDRMLDSLERTFAAQRRFTANASHELQSPLATTRTMIDVALADPDADAAGLRRLAERIRDVNEGNIDTVDALLALAVADGAPKNLTPVDLTEITRRVTHELVDEAGRAGIRIDGPLGEAVGSGSPVLLRQAVSNLVRNAIRHNRTGGWVTLELSTPPALARLTVTNTGEPVSPADLDVLRETFSRGSGRTVTRGRGHGLGLALADAAVRASGGTLQLAARPGGGLVATLDLTRESP